MPAAEDRAPKAVADLAAQVETDGGRALAVYREPVGGHWQIFALLPRERVSPTPYQRDLSPAHAKRLQAAVKKLDRFVDPIVVVSPEPGVYWTPNGHHRLSVLAKLKAEVVPAILIPEAEVAFQILALNTEKAHNLKEKSLEVIRMYRGLAESEPRRGEEDYAFQFEAAHLVTLGLLYETNRRFAGGAFAPILRRVDAFLSGTFAQDAAPARGPRGARPRGGRRPGRGGGPDQEARDPPPLREELRAGADDAPHARAQDAAGLRPDLREARGVDPGVRRGEGPLRGRPALRGLRGARPRLG